MALTAENVGVIGPPKAQLALALAIVKQKPPGGGVKDYIMQIRQSIRRAKNLDLLSDGKFFDSVCFWQRAYEESQAEQTKLLNTIFELEQRNEGLHAKLHSGSPVEGTKGVLATKRKSSGIGKIADGSPATKKRPRARHSQTDSRTTKSRPETVENEFEPPSLIRPLYTLQRAFQKRRNDSSLTVDAVTLCKTAELELLSTIHRDNTAASRRKVGEAQQTKEPDLHTVIKGVELSFHLVHKALRKITGLEIGEQSTGQITYYLVCLFESTMTALTQHCTIMSRQRNEGSTDQDQSSNTEVQTACRLTDLLCTMALSLDLARSEDQEVMEGFFFVALDRVGKLLALLVFNELQVSSDTCPDLRPPQGLVEMSQEGLSPHSAQLEAQHLIKFLDEILGKESFSFSKYSSLQCQFVRKMKGRLQKTLLRAVFGDDDPHFQEGLMRPATPPPLHCGDQQIDQPDFPEWFTRELWRLVGWDLLSSIVHPR